MFYTNGLEIYFWDLGNYPPRKVIGFPSLDDLERFRYIRRNRKPLSGELINADIAGRDYQIRAIRAVLEGIEQKKRDFLLVMATGTGKTRTCIALVDALMRAAHAERILFLVDRIALREQGLAAFKEYLPDEPLGPKSGKNRSLKTGVFIYQIIQLCLISFVLKPLHCRRIFLISLSLMKAIALSITLMVKYSITSKPLI